MAKPGPGGTIYFIAELGFDGRPSGMVKIGIVKDSDRSRTVEQRCDEHQTGNPNQLEVIHTVLSPMPEETDPRIPHRGLSRTPVRRANAETGDPTAIDTEFSAPKQVPAAHGDRRPRTRDSTQHGRGLTVP